MSEQNTSELSRTTGETPPANPAALARNLDRLSHWRERRRAKASLQDKAADAISGFAGSMMFVYLHVLVFGGWIAINLGWLPLLPAWDPTLVVLAMAASVESIFLSTFVLINQNRMAAEDEEKAELDLQINLLNEHETTRLVELVDAIAKHLGIETKVGAELEELKREVDPNTVLDEIQSRKQDR